MPVEIFSKAQFEAALPKIKGTSLPAWQCIGLDKGEYTYVIPLGTPPGSKPASILIRSSVDQTGWSRATGEDSIRVYVVENRTGKPLSGKVHRWTTRLPGWQDRMMEIVRFLAEMAVKIGECPKCHKDLTRLGKVKKAGPNKGRWFISCWKCNDHFEWMDKVDADDDNTLPECPGCDKHTLNEFTVKKEGPNKGKKFFTCADKQCGFFAWADE